MFVPITILFTITRLGVTPPLERPHHHAILGPLRHMSPHTKISPSEDDLRAALVALKTRYPSLGIVKTHSILLASYPDWTVSEKRTRKVLQSEGLILDTPSPQATDFVYPSSRLIPDLDISKWSSKVQVRYYDKRKGKGLVATEDIEEGETIWKEDPFILAPEWCEAFPFALCLYCNSLWAGRFMTYRFRLLPVAIAQLLSTCRRL